LTLTHTRERERESPSEERAAEAGCSGIVMGLVSEAEARRHTPH